MSIYNDLDWQHYVLTRSFIIEVICKAVKKLNCNEYCEHNTACQLMILLTLSETDNKKKYVVSSKNNVCVVYVKEYYRFKKTL